ncbi:Protein kinase byr2 [Smittium culicis]|uniref:Protein kinase byr2 n=1 Tax=Smittium culicis TaxID=133412 RepID=A0A1R1YK79_9FUNG|nr:Protein kinase byr2 [Smittium culicis]
MAPEIVKDSNYTQKCDIWSLGCLSIEMITGKHPYPEYDQFQALLKVCILQLLIILAFISKFNDCAFFFFHWAKE